MGDNRYVALFGVRDLRYSAAGTEDVSDVSNLPKTKSALGPVASLIRITVGGSEKVIWDVSCMQAYADAQVAFSSSAVIIPQNASYKIEFGKFMTTTAEALYHIQLIGVVVEPRGKVISP